MGAAESLDELASKSERLGMLRERERVLDVIDAVLSNAEIERGVAAAMTSLRNIVLRGPE